MIVNFLTGDFALSKNKTGVHVFHHNLLKKFAEHRYMDMNAKVSCFCTKEELEKNFPEYVHMPYSNRIVFLTKIKKMLLYFFPIEIFLGHSDFYICDGIIPRTATRSKKIAVIHDLMVYIFPENYTLVTKCYLKYYFGRCRKADRIIAVSESTKNDIVRFLKIEPGRISIVNNGVSSDAIRNTLTAKNSQIDYDVKYLLYIGDMRPNKNLKNAILAFAKVQKEDPKLHFYIAGAKKFEYERLCQLIQTENIQNVKFWGFVSDDEKEALFRNAYALLFVSLYEGFGIPILEGAKYDLPVITSNTSSMKEIAQGYSITCNPYDIDDIASAIRMLSESGYAQQIVERQRNLVNYYSWDHTYSQMASVFQSLSK